MADPKDSTASPPPTSPDTSSMSSSATVVEPGPSRTRSLRIDTTFPPGGGAATTQLGTVEVESPQPQESEPELDFDWMVFPVHPERMVSRGERQYFVEFDPTPAGYDIGPCKLNFSYDTALPPGWTAYINAEGQPFFHHLDMNILTESWLYDEKIAKELAPVAQWLARQRDQHPGLGGFQYQIVIDRDENGHPPDPDNGDDGVRYGYYLVHDKNRLIFWIEQYNIDHLLCTFGKFDARMQALALEIQYWVHYEHFANVQKPGAELWDRVTADLLMLKGDLVSSSTSTSNFSIEQVERMVSTIEKARQYPGTYHHSGTPWVIGRFMLTITKDRFFNFHGARGARLDSTVGIFDKKFCQNEKPSFLFRMLSFAMLGAPNLNLEKLQSLLVDLVTRRIAWEAFMEKTERDWEKYAGLGTIVLTANAAFLTIPGTTDTNEKPGNVWSVNLSYASMISSFGCVVLALFLIRKYRTKDQSVLETHQYLMESFDSRRTFEALAIKNSLPYALIMWSMILFLAAFLVMCLSGPVTSTRTIVGFSVGFLVFLLVWGLGYHKIAVAVIPLLRKLSPPWRAQQKPPGPQNPPAPVPPTPPAGGVVKRATTFDVSRLPQKRKGSAFSFLEKIPAVIRRGSTQEKLVDPEAGESEKTAPSRRSTR